MPGVAHRRSRKPGTDTTHRGGPFRERASSDGRAGAPATARATGARLSATYATGPAMSLGTPVQAQTIDTDDQALEEQATPSTPVQEKCTACEAEDAADDAPPVQQKCAACEKEDEEDREDSAEPVQLWDCSEYDEPTCVQTQEAPDEEPLQEKCASCESEEPVQQDEGDGAVRSPGTIHRHARSGLRDASQPLPHGDRIQAAFGRHDVSHIRTNVGGGAASANRRMGALAFTSGSRIGFRGAPSMRLAAHEAAHVVQQREGLSLPGNVGRPGDRWERHADRVADAVVSGRSAEPLLDQVTSGGAEQPDRGPEGPVQHQITEGATRLFEPPSVTPEAPTEAAGGGAGDGGGTAAAGAGETAAGGAETGAETEPAAEGSAMEEAQQGDDEAPSEVAQGAGAGAAASESTGPCGTPTAAGAAQAGAGGPAPGATAAGRETAPSSGAGATTEATNAGRENQEGGGISASCYRAGSEPPGEDTPEPTSDERGSEPEEQPGVECEPWPPAVDECPAEATVAEGAQQMPAGGGEGLATVAGGPGGGPAGATGEASAPAGPEEGGEPASAEVRSMSRAAATQAEASAADTAMEGPIASAQAARDTAVNDYLDSTAELDGVLTRSLSLESSVTFPDAQVPQQVEPRQAAISQTQAFMARVSALISPAVAFAQDQVPARLGDLAEGIKANIQGAMEMEKATISARVAQAQALARAGAAAARAHIHAEYASSAAQIKVVSGAAIAALDAKHLASVTLMDEKETTGLEDVNSRFQRGREQHEEKGPLYANRAIRRGQEHAHEYERCKGDYSDDGFWDGCLTVRRARAQQDAACKTAAGYKDTFLRTANKKGYDLIQLRKQYRCAVIAGARQVNRTLDDTHDSTVSGLESGRAQALGAIGLARDENLSSINAALSATLQSLAAQEASQRQTVNDTGYLKQLAVEQLAHAGAAGLARGITAAMDSLEATLDTLRQQFAQGGIPDPATLAEALANAEAALGGGMGTLLAKMEEGAAQAEGQLDSLGGAALEALGIVTRKNDELCAQAESGFSQQMSGLKAGATATFAELTGKQVEQAMTAMTEGTASMDAAVAGFDSSLATIGGKVDEAIATSLGELEQQLDDKLAELDGQIAREAWKAAEKEQPAWKSVVAIVLIIVVIIAAVVISIVTLGAGASLFAIILVGALVGAVSAGLIQIISNWSSGEAWHEGVVQAMVIGAVGGALGGGLGFAGGALASGAAAAGASVVRQAVITVGADLLAESLTQTFAYVAYGQDFNWQGFVMAGAMSGVSFRAHPAGPRGIGARPDVPLPGAAAAAGGRRAVVTQIAGGAALGLGIEYATAKISGQEFDPTKAASAAASVAVGARMARRTPAAAPSQPTSRLGRAAQRARSFDPGGVGARLETGLQGLGARMAGAQPEAGAPGGVRPGTEEPATRPVAEPETARPRTDIASEGGPIRSRGELADELRRPRSDSTEEGEVRRPSPREESTPEPGVTRREADIEIGELPHTVKIFETADGPSLIICTSCRKIVDYIRLSEAMPDLSPQVRARLEELRARVETTEANLRSGKASDDVNTMRNMLRIMAEVDFMVPRELAPGAVRRPSESFDNLTADPAVARRAGELFGDIYARLWGSRREMFRGRGQAETLKRELTKEARARALHQARIEVEAGMSPRPPQPEALEPGAPARTTFDPDIDVPMGFRDRAGFEAFSSDLNVQLRAVEPDASLVLQGSSLPGRRFERSVDFRHTGEPFDVGRISDYDIAIVSDKLHARATDLGIDLGQGPLTQQQLRDLGLGDLHDVAQAASLRDTGIAHEVHFKLYPEGAVPSTGLDIPLPNRG